MAGVHEETVISVRHWTDDLFSFKTTRKPSFRFESGQFTMLGLPVNGKPLLRAYSMTSAPYEEQLEFYSIKVPTGPLTSRLRYIKEGETLLVGEKATGTLVMHSLLPGRTLYLLATGTGLAPFASLIKDPEVYDRFDRVVLAHSCREVAELGYGEAVLADLNRNELIGDLVRDKLTYYPTVTREPFRNRGRLTDLLASGRLASDIGAAGFSPETDRAMLCGSPWFLNDCCDLLDSLGFRQGSASTPGEYVIEKSFVER